MYYFRCPREAGKEKLAPTHRQWVIPIKANGPSRTQNSCLRTGHYIGSPMGLELIVLTLREGDLEVTLWRAFK